MASAATTQTYTMPRYVTASDLLARAVVQSTVYAPVDYVHGNAIEPDTDGNLLLSSRHINEITKINRSTGDIIWRLGGKNNQFTFVGDPTLPNVGGFSYQHDIRRLPNGNITLFDNALQFWQQGLRNSRGVEYALDEAAKTVTLVKEFKAAPEVMSQYMGNLQRLPNGNSFIGWGGGLFPPAPAPPTYAATEFTAQGQPALHLNFHNEYPFVSYRAFRFPWQVFPITPPVIVAITNTEPISLYYSWNGATEVASYSSRLTMVNRPTRGAWACLYGIPSNSSGAATASPSCRMICCAGN